MDVRGKKQESPGGDDRRCLHVQGISHWAPANIGPYSQGYLAGEYLHVSGQIGLIPGKYFSWNILTCYYSLLGHNYKLLKKKEPLSFLLPY